MTVETILDLVVIALLIPTIVYAVVLNRRLAALRRSRDELAKVVANFNDATMRAEAGIPKLKKATTEANLALKDRVEKAQTLRDDLAFMVERAEELASRLEGAVRAARNESLPGLNTAANAAPATTIAGGGLRAAAATEAPAAARAAAPAATLASSNAIPFGEAAADLRNALNAARAEARVAGAPSAATLRGQRRPIADELAAGDDRSEAERELLKALQTAR
ncbi:MAG: DUF6468 domain-containing protein [Rhodospirillaceae bacterium]|nr:DUF6468 domain-containing protein [Rhodospirillaceae bacterium]